MPNSDFDKTLKEKLSAYEAGFHPADWQKMEAMLPQDSRKPFLLVTFLFGFFFLGISGLLMNHLLTDKRPEGNAARMVAEIPKAESHSPEAINADEGQKENSNGTENGKGNLKETTRSPESGLQNEPKSNAQTQKHQPPAKNGNLSKSLKELTGSKKSQAGEKKFSSTKRKKGNANAEKQAVITTTDSYESDDAELLAMLKAGEINSTLTEDIRTTFDAPERKKKRKVFEFALGVGGGPNISFIDASYLTKPGYAAGISQEFMFIDRIGLALLESYVIRRYDGGNYPCPAGYVNCPESYASDVKSFDLGIDLKVNLIHKPRWNWYAKAGVVNVFKLKEIFEFTYSDIDTVASPPGETTQTNFNGSTNSLVANQDAYTGFTLPNAFSPNPEPLPDLTISGAKRFHPAYHFATGFDVALNSRIKLQFETGYSFTKPAVGADEKRLHSIGLNGGVFCIFGK